MAQKVAFSLPEGVSAKRLQHLRELLHAALGVDEGPRLEERDRELRVVPHAAALLEEPAKVVLRNGDARG